MLNNVKNIRKRYYYFELKKNIPIFADVNIKIQQRYGRKDSDFAG